MKKTLCLTVAICLVLSLLFGTLCACNRTKDEKQKERESAVESVHTAFIGGVRQDWQVDLSDEQIAQLDNGGDYIVTDGWTQLVCDVLKKSSIQTAKISALANAFNSQDGKDMLGDFENNGTKLISLLKTIGFTSSDVSNIVVDLLKALVNDSAQTINDMVDKLNRVKECARENQTAFDNINANIAVVNVAKTNFLLSASEKSALLEALNNAENAIGSLVDFAYNMSVNDIFGDLLETLVLENGALGDISTSEIVTFVGAIMQNVSELKNALTQSEIEKLNTALNLVIEKFDTSAITSVLYVQVIKYAKYAYMVVDVLPTVCDIVNACGDIVGKADFVENVKAYALSKDSLNANANTMNEAILFANILQNIMNNFDAQSWASVIDQIGLQGQDEYQKAVPIMAIDIVLNSVGLVDIIDGKEEFSTVHTDILSVDDFAKCVSLVLFFNGGIDRFVDGYNQYLAGQIDIYKLQNLANMCSFGDFGIENMFSPITQTQAWYNYYMVNGVQAVKAFVRDTLPCVLDDIKAFANDFYLDNSTSCNALAQLAQLPLFTQDLSEEELDEYLPLIKQAGLFILFALTI